MLLPALSSSDDGNPIAVSSPHFSIHAKKVKLATQRHAIHSRNQRISPAVRSNELDYTAAIPHPPKTSEQLVAVSSPSVRSSEQMKTTGALRSASGLRKGAAADGRDTFQAEPHTTPPPQAPVPIPETVVGNTPQAAPPTESSVPATPKPRREARVSGPNDQVSTLTSKRAPSVANASAYGAEVWAALRRHKPRVRQTGSAAVTFGIDTSGALRHARVSQSSGNAYIDRMALKTVRNAAPFPSPPPGLNPDYAVRIYF
jgi:TonB family protein